VVDDLALSIVIVNWNAGRDLAACLRSIYANEPGVAWEVILVDNASTDGSHEAVCRAHPDIRLIANTKNVGLAAGNNQGIEEAKGQMVLVSNPDVIYRPGAIDGLVTALGRHAGAAFVIPRLLYEDGELQTSAGDLPTLYEALLGRRAQRRATNDDAVRGYWWDGWAHDEERQVGRGHEASYLIRRAAIDEVGLQDERFFLDWEGIDWTARMRGAGWEIWFTPAAEVVHIGGTSIRQVPFRWIVRSHRGMYRYFVKRHPWWKVWLGPVLTARAGVKLAAASISDIYGRAHRVD